MPPVKSEQDAAAHCASAPRRRGPEERLDTESERVEVGISARNPDGRATTRNRWARGLRQIECKGWIRRQYRYGLGDLRHRRGLCRRRGHSVERRWRGLCDVTTARRLRGRCRATTPRRTPVRHVSAATADRAGRTFHQAARVDSLRWDDETRQQKGCRDEATNNQTAHPVHIALILGIRTGDVHDNPTSPCSPSSDPGTVQNKV